MDWNWNFVENSFWDSLQDTVHKLGLSPCYGKKQKDSNNYGGWISYLRQPCRRHTKVWIYSRSRIGSTRLMSSVQICHKFEEQKFTNISNFHKVIETIQKISKGNLAFHLGDGFINPRSTTSKVHQGNREQSTLSLYLWIWLIARYQSAIGNILEVSIQ